MSSSACRPGQLAGDHLLELVHLEPVEHALRHGLDQVAGLDLRVVERVAADERRALEDGVVELARLRVVRARRADERARLQPLAAQHRVARGRDRDDHVAGGRRRGGSRPARRRPPCRTPPAAPRSGSTRPSPRSPAAPRGCRRPACVPGSRSRSRRASAPRACARCFAATALAAPVRSCPSRSASITALSSPRSKSTTTNETPSGAGGVRLHAREPTLVVDRRHHRQEAAGSSPNPVAGDVLDRSGGEPQERVLDRLDRVAPA